MTAQQLGDAATELPSFVRIGERGKALPGAGLLGVEFDPLVIGNAAKPPENSSPRTSKDRFRRRLALMQRMNKSYATHGGRQEAQDHSQLYAKAAKMILSPEMRAFDLSAESPAMRTAYGDTDFGNGCLMARRLIEAGVTFVEVSLGIGTRIRIISGNRRNCAGSSIDPTRSCCVTCGSVACWTTHW